MEIYSPTFLVRYIFFSNTRKSVKMFSFILTNLDMILSIGEMCYCSINRSLVGIRTSFERNLSIYSQHFDTL